MNKGTEFNLLADLSKLLKKYGPDTFDRLAELLTKPEFANRLAQLLSMAARDVREVRLSHGGSEPKPSFRSSLVDLANTDSTKGSLLLRAYDDLMAKIVLPTAQDLRDFAAIVRLGPLKFSSRRQAIVAILEALRSRPLEELKSLIEHLNSTPGPNDRGLENWTRIILDKDLRTRKAQ